MVGMSVRRWYELCVPITLTTLLLVETESDEGEMKEFRVKHDIRMSCLQRTMRSDFSGKQRHTAVILGRCTFWSMMGRTCYRMDVVDWCCWRMKLCSKADDVL